MKKRQIQFNDFKARFQAICLAEGGTSIEPIGTGLAYLIPTHLGQLQASIHELPSFPSTLASIYLRFETYSTGKVYDELCGYEFNGYSGKWNIHVSGSNAKSRDMAEIYQAAIHALIMRLGKLRGLAEQTKPTETPSETPTMAQGGFLTEKGTKHGLD